MGLAVKQRCWERAGLTAGGWWEGKDRGAGRGVVSEEDIVGDMRDHLHLPAVGAVAGESYIQDNLFGGVQMTAYKIEKGAVRKVRERADRSNIRTSQGIGVFMVPLAFPPASSNGVCGL